MSTLADRLSQALAARQAAAAAGERITKAGLARACGIKQPSVSDWFNGQTATIEGQNLIAAAAYLGVSPEWLATGKGQRRPREDSPLRVQEKPAPYFGGQAHDMSPRPFTLPVQITWEQLMQTKELPERFVVETPDDALAPNLPRGTAVVFERASAPQPGECVLVQDSRGARYMRRYVQGVGGAFTAQALNDAYVTLESGRDGLTVLAVMAWRAESRV